MQITKLLAAVLISSLLFSACNSDDQHTTAIPTAGTAPLEEAVPIDDYWARDNFDLQRVGPLLERSDSPEEFERYLNDDDYGVNNLDLNGDGYADYISVEEIEDRDDDSRGLSLFSRFGPDMIQQIATIFFYRDRPNYPGSRIMLVGDDHIYGDNHYYETNWLDRSLQMASFMFGDHNRYVSPYYHDNYPSWYSPYQIIETPVYRTRIVEMYPEPVFVYTNAAPAYFSDIEIRSPYDGKWMEKVHAKLAKPTKEQESFIKSNPSRRQFAKRDDRGFQADTKPGRDDPPRSARGDERGNPGRDERGAQRGNPDRPAPKFDRGPDMKPAGRPDNPGRGGGNPNKSGGNPNAGGNPNKGGGNPNAGGGNPNKGGGNPNKGGGNPNKGGGNPNKGGGGGKGGGKGKP